MSAQEHVLDHVYTLFYEELNLCGCGNPEEAYDLVRDLLGLVPFYDNPDAVRDLIGQPGAYHMVLSALTHADLIGHGSSIGGSWLTDKGRWYLAALRGIADWDVIDDAGYPHVGVECTDGCWRVPIGGQETTR